MGHGMSDVPAGCQGLQAGWLAACGPLGGPAKTGPQGPRHRGPGPCDPAAWSPSRSRAQAGDRAAPTPRPARPCGSSERRGEGDPSRGFSFVRNDGKSQAAFPQRLEGKPQRVASRGRLWRVKPTS